MEALKQRWPTPFLNSEGRGSDACVDAIAKGGDGAKVRLITQEDEDGGDGGYWR
jgi:hypothetical protein